MEKKKKSYFLKVLSFSNGYLCYFLVSYLKLQNILINKTPICSLKASPVSLVICKKLFCKKHIYPTQLLKTLGVFAGNLCFDGHIRVVLWICGAGSIVKP